MSGDGACLCMAVDVAAHLCLAQRIVPDDLPVPPPAPWADEARAMADNLRDMLATGKIDQRLVRLAANAFDAAAAILPMRLELLPSREGSAP